MTTLGAVTPRAASKCELAVFIPFSQRDGRATAADPELTSPETLYARLFFRKTLGMAHSPSAALDGDRLRAGCGLAAGTRNHIKSLSHANYLLDADFMPCYYLSCQRGRTPDSKSGAEPLLGENQGTPEGRSQGMRPWLTMASKPKPTESTMKATLKFYDGGPIGGWTARVRIGEVEKQVPHYATSHGAAYPATFDTKDQARKAALRFAKQMAAEIKKKERAA